MDESMSESVIKVFVDLYKKGFIYRGIRMVNWDPKAKTALSDEEVIHKEVSSKLFYISYAIKESDEKITIATTRPETILGDSAICINPNDKRYLHLKGINGRKMWSTWEIMHDLLSSGSIDVESIVTHRLGINEFQKGIELTRSGLCGKVILDF